MTARKRYRLRYRSAQDRMYGIEHSTRLQRRRKH